MLSVAKQIKKRAKDLSLRKIVGFDGLVVTLLPLFAMIFSFLFKPGFLISILLFLGIPALYLSVRFSKYVTKISVFSLIASLPLMVILEYIGGLSLSWSFPPSAFHFKLFDRVYLEVLLWAFLNIYTSVIFYEVFFENHKKVRVWSKRMWTLVRYLAVWVILFFGAFIFTDGKLSLPYFYLLFGVVVFIYPILMTWLYYPRIMNKVAYTAIYFSYLSLIYEITALKLGWWYFPGTEFIGRVSFLGTIFPLEELIFWIILFAPAVVCAYEYLEDDHR